MSDSAALEQFLNEWDDSRILSIRGEEFRWYIITQWYFGIYDILEETIQNARVDVLVELPDGRHDLLDKIPFSWFDLSATHDND